ncbi:MAG: 3-methyl-2-oxobutanoate dehydrogenase subunit VorB [Oscillospiraceae bacterium]|nr:3-methyl-2-oxobutanoate dehydrogenase subunit VorB [Oscillospiraceae bacterium]
MIKTLLKGNEALAQAAIMAGCKSFFGYPITPQTEISAYMAKRMPKEGGVFLQAESEIAAVNMVLGAAAAGVRTMTSSSSPGISLKSEGISYIAGSDLPCVIINVQRGGPGLGGIQPSQADYWQATRALGHGDFHVLVYAPASVQEMVDLVIEAFDRADEYRMPAMLLADGMLGQMMEPVTFPEVKKNVPDKPWATNGHQGKRDHNVANSLFLSPGDLHSKVVRRFEKYKEIEQKLPKAETYKTEDADIIVTAYGAAARIARSAVNMARKEGIKAGLIRPVTLYPFPKEIIRKHTENAKEILCVEMSMGQMVEDVRLSVECKKPVRFYGKTGGLIPEPAEVFEQIKRIEKRIGGAY